jgi:hypothetical protein
MTCEAEARGMFTRKDEVKMKLKSFVPKKEGRIAINCIHNGRVYPWAVSGAGNKRRRCVAIDLDAPNLFLDLEASHVARVQVFHGLEGVLATDDVASSDMEKDPVFQFRRQAREFDFVIKIDRRPRMVKWEIGGNEGGGAMCLLPCSAAHSDPRGRDGGQFRPE